ncbi:ParA family protein [Azospirillum doebereinerae]|uniref:ParA family protein n=1 Tax=Azospirillum doebereinerae TaxID=92933 RepID=A0A3S0VEM4_9PROT|nr:ParA family protein [Azospirillum doebereinerae]RUQ64011.1 ParA family protein [Azospirillum doebereinerae]
MKTVLVVQGKGGGPKTATARNLAVAAAVAGLRVGTLDADPQGSLTYWHAQRPAEVAAIRHEQRALGDIDRKPTPEGLDLLVIDTPTAIEFFPEATGLLFDSADLVLVPVRPGPEDLVSMEGMLPYLRARRRPTRLLLSQIHPRLRETADARAVVAGMGTVAPVEIPHLQEVPRSFLAGLGTAEVAGTRTGPLFSNLWAYVAQDMGV